MGGMIGIRRPKSAILLLAPLLLPWTGSCSHYLSPECRVAMNHCLESCNDAPDIAGSRNAYPPLGSGTSGFHLRDSRTPCQRDCQTPQRFAQCR